MCPSVSLLPFITRACDDTASLPTLGKTRFEIALWSSCKRLRTWRDKPEPPQPASRGGLKKSPQAGNGEPSTPPTVTANSANDPPPSGAVALGDDDENPAGTPTMPMPSSEIDEETGRGAPSGTSKSMARMDVEDELRECLLATRQAEVKNMSRPMYTFSRPQSRPPFRKGSSNRHKLSGLDQALLALQRPVSVVGESSAAFMVFLSWETVASSARKPTREQPCDGRHDCSLGAAVFVFVTKSSIPLHLNNKHMEWGRRGRGRTISTPSPQHDACTIGHTEHRVSTIYSLQLTESRFLTPRLDPTFKTILGCGG